MHENQHPEHHSTLSPHRCDARWGPHLLLPRLNRQFAAERGQLTHRDGYTSLACSFWNKRDEGLVPKITRQRAQYDAVVVRDAMVVCPTSWTVQPAGSLVIHSSARLMPNCRPTALTLSKSITRCRVGHRIFRLLHTSYHQSMCRKQVSVSRPSYPACSYARACAYKQTLVNPQHENAQSGVCEVPE